MNVKRLQYWSEEERNLLVERYSCELGERKMYRISCRGVNSITDANLWLLAIKVYFAMNPSLYEEKNKILAILNKMDASPGKSFAKGWLMKCPNENIKDKDWTFARIKANFIAKFIPSNHATKAWHSLMHIRMEGEPFNGDFHKFKSKFEHKAAPSGVTNEHILMDILGKAVSANLAFKMMVLLEELKDHKVWLHKTGQFYNAAVQMKKL